MPTNIAGRVYLFVDEVATMAGVAEITIRRYAKEGKIRYFQSGGSNARLLFPVDCLEQSGSLGRQPDCDYSRFSNRSEAPFWSAAQVAIRLYALIR